MSDETSTPTSSKYEILSDFWIQYKDDMELADFMSYNDLGLPLAYAVSVGIVNATEKSDLFVDETWDLFLATMGVTDTGFESLEDVMNQSR